MRRILCGAALVGAVLISLPCAAAIRALTLDELTAITHETLLVQVTGRSTFTPGVPDAESVWTRLSVEGESLRSGEAFSGSVAFLGSHDPADHFGTSEMPTLQDTRTGGTVLLLAERLAEFPGGPTLVAHNLAYIYRVEQGFGTPVVVGKGEGAAFPANVKLSEARALAHAAHLKSQSAAAGK
jgi:hypothetical protein